MTALNTAIAELQTHAARHGASKQGMDHSVTVVDTLKSRLMGATKSFKETLVMRQENVKNQAARRGMFSNQASAGPARPNPFARADGGGGGSFPRLAAGGMGAGAAGGGGGGGGAGGGSLQLSRGGLPTHSAPGQQQAQGQVLLAGPSLHCTRRVPIHTALASSSCASSATRSLVVYLYTLTSSASTFPDLTVHQYTLAASSLLAAWSTARQPFCPLKSKPPPVITK
jgi:hypothetical protein